MDWKKRYTRKQIGVIKGVPIYENGFYIFNGGEPRRKTVQVSDGYVIQVNKIDKKNEGIWFDNRLTNGNRYTYNVYASYFVREATKKEIKKWKVEYGV